MSSNERRCLLDVQCVMRNGKPLVGAFALRLTHSTLNTRHRRRGVSLIELLIVMIISSIAMMALAIPFADERLFWGVGKRQTESQRDAQVALRTMANEARESDTCQILPAGATSAAVSFHDPFTGQGACFVGGPVVGGQLIWRAGIGTGCEGATVGVLIDGVRSRVVQMTATEIVDNQLVRVLVQVAHRLRTTDPRQQDELLETQFYLRNGT